MRATTATDHTYDSADTEALHDALERARQASCAAERSMLEDDIVRDQLPLATALARRYADRGADLDDLKAVASLALLKAIRGFEPSLGSFRPYATATILGEIKKYFRDHCWAVRPTRRIQELQAEIVHATGERTQDSESVRPADLAECLGVDVSDVNEALNAFGLYAPRSLDSTTVGGTAPLRDRVAADDRGFEAVDQRLTAMAACDHLDDDDRRLLHLRFVEELTQQEIGEIIGANQVQVSRRLTRLMRTMRTLIESDTPAAARRPAAAPVRRQVALSKAS
jgi:RNA polymerase sigma-B factor